MTFRVERVCEWLLLVKSVSKLYLQVDLICQNRHLVSYQQVPGSIPGSIDFFFLFSPIFLSFLTRSPLCSTRISKVGKCAVFQLWTPTYFWVIFKHRESPKLCSFFILSYHISKEVNLGGLLSQRGKNPCFLKITTLQFICYKKKGVRRIFTSCRRFHSRWALSAPFSFIFKCPVRAFYVISRGV